MSTDHTYDEATRTLTHMRKTVPYFRRFGSIAMLHAKGKLEPLMVAWEFEEPKVKIRAPVADIKAFGLVNRRTNSGEMTGYIEHHYPLDKWEVVEGDKNWWKPFYEQTGHKER